MKAEPHPAKRARHSNPRTPVIPHVAIATVPKKWRWHYRVLQKLRDHFVDERAAELAEAAEPIEPHSMDPADSASDEFDHELAVSLLSGGQDALYQVDSAMKRIAAGTYGICEKTGKRIPMTRLRAVPWTCFTKEAEEALEREGGFHRLGLAKVASVQGLGPGGLAKAEEPENEELQARVIRGHQLAESLKTLEEGEKIEPETEEPVRVRAARTDGAATHKLAGRSSTQTNPRKSRRKRNASS